MNSTSADFQNLYQALSHSAARSPDALALAFDTLSLPEVFGLVRPDHAASIRVLEKLGMQRFGLLDDVPGQAPSLVLRVCHPTTAQA